jgi:hypothetical protein
MAMIAVPLGLRHSPSIGACAAAGTDIARALRPRMVLVEIVFIMLRYGDFVAKVSKPLNGNRGFWE